MASERKPSENDTLRGVANPPPQQSDSEAENQRAIDSVLRYIDPLGTQLDGEADPDAATEDDAPGEMPNVRFDEPGDSDGGDSMCTEPGAAVVDASPAGKSAASLTSLEQPASDEEAATHFHNAQIRDASGIATGSGGSSRDEIGSATTFFSPGSPIFHAQPAFTSSLPPREAPLSIAAPETNANPYVLFRSGAGFDDSAGSAQTAEREPSPPTHAARSAASSSSSQFLFPTSDGGPPLARPIVVVSFFPQKTSRVVQDALDAAAARDAKTLDEIAEDAVGWEMFKRDARLRACRGR